MALCHVQVACSERPEPAQAVAEVAAQLDTTAPLILAFASPTYDRQALASALGASFAGVLAGCTTSGQLSPGGFQRRGLTVAALSGSVHADRYTLRLDDVAADACRVGELVRARRASLPPSWRSFGLLLVDGLSLSEERLTASLYAALGSVPLVGGSAGDDLRFESTHVLTETGFRQGAASLVVVHTSAPFEIFRAQHFVATDVRLVVTRADPARRIVYELDGEPAMYVYARAIGAEASALGPELYSQHPVMLRLQGEDYIRSIQRAGAGGSLAFYCAIDEGLVLRLGQAVDPLRRRLGTDPIWAAAEIHSRAGGASG
ncbi:MAG: hypothetical protein IT378_19265 [Sandaracinaceae bacterium]|nr:hypothetical protein [Sandaracinaceae bacterium]